MKITIYNFGKIKFQELKTLEEYYLKLASRYLKLEIIELKDISDRKIKKEDIEKYLSGPERTIILSEAGREFKTKEFVEKIKKWMLNSVDVNMFIANAFGFEREVKNSVDSTLSLSKMTFPHELARVLLMEQFYRASDIIRGGKYHK